MMRLPPLARQRITVVTRQWVGEDELGNDRYDDVEETVTGCAVQPLRTSEQIGDRDTVVNRWQLWAPADTPLAATSRVRADDGTLFEVEGQPQVWPGIDGRPHHVTALLVAWTG